MLDIFKNIFIQNNLTVYKYNSMKVKGIHVRFINTGRGHPTKTNVTSPRPRPEPEPEPIAVTKKKGRPPRNIEDNLA